MSYDLEFKESALKEWRKLDSRIAERLVKPRVEAARLLRDAELLQDQTADSRLQIGLSSD